jgi:hypothetical protein
MKRTPKAQDELVLNRQLLHEHALDLMDADYVQVVAALGATPLSWTSQAFGKQRSLRWRVRDLERRLGSGSWDRSPSTWQQVRQAQEGWDGRLIVDDYTEEEGAEHDLLDVLRVLSHPAVGARAVQLRRRLRRADPRWQWPLRLATFESDSEPLGRRSLAGKRRRELVRTQLVSREAARSEVLVMTGTPRLALHCHTSCAPPS